MEAIVVTEKNWGIGKDGDLLASLPGDLQYFKEHTLEKTILMGRKTLESLPGGKPLPGRDTIVFSTSESFAEFVREKAACGEEKEKKRWGRCTVEPSMEKYLSAEGIALDSEVLAAGGESVYRACLPYCSRVYVTRMECALEADRFFPNLDEDPEWEIEEESSRQEENGVGYRWVTYVRRKEKES